MFNGISVLAVRPEAEQEERCTLLSLSSRGLVLGWGGVALLTGRCVTSNRDDLCWQLYTDSKLL